MQIELKRRTFIGLLGMTAAAAVTAAPAGPKPAKRKTARPEDPHPRCFFSEQENQPPVSPKTAAITYLQAC